MNCHQNVLNGHPDLSLSVPWSLRPQNRAAAATCGRGRCDFPAILRLTPKSLAASDFFAAAEAKNPAISAAEWLRARLRPPWSLRFCDAIFVPLSPICVDLFRFPCFFRFAPICGPCFWECPDLFRSLAICPDLPCFLGIPCFFPFQGLPFFHRFPLLSQGF